MLQEKKNTDLGIPWQPSGENLALSLPWSWVQSLAKELRSHKLSRTAKKTNKTQKTKQKKNTDQYLSQTRHKIIKQNFRILMIY